MAGFYIPACGGPFCYQNVEEKERKAKSTGTKGTNGLNDEGSSAEDPIYLEYKVEQYKIGIQDMVLRATPVVHELDQVYMGDEIWMIKKETLLSWARAAVKDVDVGVDVIAAFKLIEEFGCEGFTKTNYRTKIYNGKTYIIFKGRPGLRKTLTGVRYLANNAKVVNMGIGPRGLVRRGVKGGILTFVLVAAADVWEYFANDEATLADLGVTLIIDATKTVIATSVAISASVLVAFAGAPVFVVFAVGFIAYIVASEGLDYLDEKYEVSERLKKWANAQVDQMQEDLEDTRYEWRRWLDYLNSPKFVFDLHRY